MSTRPRHVLLVGSFAPAALERSYRHAFLDARVETTCFDLPAALRGYCRLGTLGRTFNRFVPVDPWTIKANRELVVLARRTAPDLIVVFGQNRVSSGALAQLRAMMPSLQLVLVWPDTLVNMSAATQASLPHYDLVATYSRSTVPVFERLGAQRVAWIPLAADPHMHLLRGERPAFTCDVGFIGQWRPEREAAFLGIFEQCPDAVVRIWGPDWKRRSRNAGIRRAWQGGALFEEAYARTIASCRLNLNIIDETNYPAANMRFFEVLCAGGLLVCSPCPELDQEFVAGETVFYYQGLADLPVLVRQLLSEPDVGRAVAAAGHQKVLERHTYLHRVSAILDAL